jgi:glutathione synthase
MNKLGVVMDPIGSINIKKDSTFAMLLEAQRRSYSLFYLEQTDMYFEGSQARAKVRPVTVEDNPEKWFELGKSSDIALSELDIILMRKDPPFNMDYIYSTYLLEAAERDGTLVVNKPRSLRDHNEKLFALSFPECIAPTKVSASQSELKAFITEQKDVILKPLDGMGGESIFRVKQDDANLNVILETLTIRGKRLIMAQRFIPEISRGDKRILLINGEPIPYALARIPAKGETRGNLAAGGHAEGVELSERDRWICQQVGSTLKEKGLMFVGLDVIGDYLTEVNVTSPTCIRELDTIYNLNICATLFNEIEKIKT